MKTGHDQQLRTNVSVKQYFDAWGPKLDRNGGMRVRPVVICPACNSSLHTVGEVHGAVDATWAHDPSPSTLCPIKDGGAEKYTLLKPSSPDVEAARALRRSFFVNWKLHWSFARTFASYANIETFTGFIRYADRMGFWENATVNEWQIPYTFLAMCDFPPPVGIASARRRNWLRFRFDSKLRTIEDLWIRIIPNLRFLKLEYHIPRSGEPTPAHFIDSISYTPDARWMTAHEVVSPHPFAIRHMHQDFPEELGPLSA